MKFLSLLNKIIISLICSLFIITTAHASIPVVFFSDMTDAPVSGWEGSASKGAAVSIWGLNFGTSRGSGYVSIGGLNLVNSSDYAEWGSKTNPTTARDLQRITFWLNSSIPTGPTTISVTTADGTSRTIPFYARNTGNIYFLSTSGRDSANGRTLETAWRNPSKARGSLKAGDVAYFRGGLYNKEDNWSAIIDLWSNNHSNGTKNNSITMKAYPGDNAQLGNGTISHVIAHHGSDGDILNYWTFSNFTMISGAGLTNWGLRTNGSDNNFRFVGNDCTNVAGAKTIVDFSGKIGGSTYLYVLGNYVHDAGVNNRGDSGAEKGYGLYIEGYGTQNHVYIGYNEFCYMSNGKGIQVYGHTVNDWVDNIHIFSNLIHHNSMNGLLIGGGDGGGGSYSYQFIKNAYIYNNVFHDNNYNNSGTREDIQFGGVGYGRYGGNYYIYNNTLGGSTGDAITVDGRPDYVEMKNNIIVNSHSFYEDSTFENNKIPVVGKNLYTGGATDIPSWESNYFTVDPIFAGASNDNYSLQSESSVKDAGETISLFNTDYLGVVRVPGSYSIGAFEDFTCSISLQITSIEIK